MTGIYPNSGASITTLPALAGPIPDVGEYCTDSTVVGKIWRPPPAGTTESDIEAANTDFLSAYQQGLIQNSTEKVDQYSEEFEGRTFAHGVYAWCMQ